MDPLARPEVGAGLRPAFITTVPTFGGAEHNLLRLAGELRRRGVTPAVVLLPAGGPLTARFRTEHLDVCEFHLYGWQPRSPWRFVQSMAEMAGPIIWQRANIVHVNHEYAVAHTIRAARISRRPVVVSVRGVHERGWDGETIEWLGRASAVVAVSQATKRTLVASGLDPGRIVVIYDGVDDAMTSTAVRDDRVRRDLGAADGDVVIGAVTRLDPVKGIPFLLEAAAMLASDIRGLRVVVVGTGQPDYEARLRTIAHDLGLGDRVTWTGFREDIADLLRAMDVCVLPTYDPHGDWQEACPNTVLEAMACGTPVVATRSGGAVELLGNERGILVDAGSATAVADGIRRVLEMDARARLAMVERARAAVLGDYSLQWQTRRLVDVYMEALG